MSRLLTLLLVAGLLLAAAAPAQAVLDRWTVPAQRLSPPGAGGAALDAGPEGDQVAAWVEGGRVVTAVAAPGAPFRALDTIVKGAYAGGLPALAVGPAGSAVLAWVASVPEGLVVQASVRPAGGRFGQPVRLSAPASRPLAPGAAIRADGAAAVAWRRFAGDRYQPEVALSVPGGAFGPAEPVGRPGVYVQPTPAFAANGSPILAVMRSAPRYRPFVADRGPAGWGELQPVDPGGAEPAGGLEVKAAPDGRTIVGYQEFGPQSRALVAERAPGGPFGAPQQLSAPSEVAAFGRLDVGPEGDVVVAWQRGLPRENDPDAATEVIVRRRGAGQAAFGPPEVLSAALPGNSTTPEVTVSALRVHVAWVQRLEGFRRIVAAMAPRSAAFAAPQGLNEFTGEEYTTIQAAAGGAEAAAVVWRDAAGAVLASHRTAGSTGAPLGTSGSPSSSLDSAADDRRRPRVRVRATRVQRLGRAGVVRLRVTCNEPCALRASGRFARNLSRLRPVSAVLPRPRPGTQVLRLAFTSRTARLLRTRLGRRGAVLTVRLTATDASGNGTRTTVRVRVRR